jgi:glycosyltransferase involved in cell wall biosynthesis
MHILITAVSRMRSPAGICRYAVNLATCLARTRSVSRVTIVIGRWQAAYYRRSFDLNLPNLTLIEVQLHNHAISRNWWYLYALPDVVRHCAPDLVHLSFPAPVQSSALDCPTVCTVHDLYPYDLPENFRFPALNRVVLRHCLRASERIVCVSTNTEQRLRSLLPMCAQRATTIYNCAFPGSFQPEPVPDFPSGQFVLSVADHRRHKNLPLLVRAIALVRHSPLFDRLRLVIIGQRGPATGDLISEITHCGLQNHVLLMHGLPDSQLRWLYKNCALLVAASSIEGFCLPVVEALQCGAPVVASDIPVLRETGGNACSYFPLNVLHPENALAQAIAAALQHPHWGSTGLSRYSPQTMSSDYFALYSELLARRRPSLVPEHSGSTV